MESQPTFATTEPKPEKKPEKFDSPEAEVQWSLDHPPTAEDRLKSQAAGYVYGYGAEAALKFSAALAEAAAEAAKPKAEPKDTKTEKESETHHSSHSRA